MEHALRQNSVNVTWATMVQTAATSRVKLLILVLVMISFVYSTQNECLHWGVGFSVSYQLKLSTELLFHEIKPTSVFKLKNLSENPCGITTENRIHIFWGQISG